MNLQAGSTKPIGASPQNSFRIPFLFIATGIVMFIIFNLLSLGTFADWMKEYPRSSPVLSNVHLLVLGWGTMIAMGAVYQLIQVVLQSKVYSDLLGYLNYGLFTIGVVGLILGFRFSVTWIAVFATFAFLGIALFVFNLGITLWRAKHWNSITISVSCAILYLLFTGLTGMTMGLNFFFGGLGELHNRIFGAHIWFGALGWFGLLITGFSYKLLPMFYLSHDYSTSLQRLVVILWNAGVLTGAVSYLMNGSGWWQWISILFIATALGVYIRQFLQIRKARFKANPGSGVKFTLWVNVGLLTVSILILTLFPFIRDSELQNRMFVVVGWSYLWGWVALTILGYLSKIVPFLWWTYKYGSKAGKTNVPKLNEMISDQQVKSGLYALSISLLALMVGIGFGLEILVSLAGSALSIFSLGYIALIALVFTK